MQRNGITPLKANTDEKPATMAEELDPTIDEGCFGCELMIHTEEEIESMLQAAPRMMADDGDYPEANFIVDVFVLHNRPNPNPVIPNYEKIPEHYCRTAVHSLHHAMRNTGPNYHPEGVDTKINVGMGDVYYVNGHDVWGDVWDEGVNYSGGNGPNHGEIMSYCKNLAGTYGDPTRYAICVYPKAYGTTAVGWAYVGVNATNKLAGHFVKWSHIGDSNPFFLQEGEAPLPSTRNNKTVVHEFGHSLALWHTFHSTPDCAEETNCALQGDRVCDTNRHSRYNHCGYSLTENPRNNHMSYSGSNYRVVFTQGQKERMRGCVATRYEETLNNPYYDWDNPTDPPVEVPGCTDPDAINYNPNATIDDGSCEYPPPPIMPTIKTFIQTGTGEIAEFEFTVENTDSVELIATNENGSVSQAKVVEFDTTEPPPPPKDFDIMVSEVPNMSPAIPINGATLQEGQNYYIFLKTKEDGQTKFYTNGELTQTENVRPYTYNGDGGGLANPVTFNAGNYEIRVTQNGNEVISSFEVV